MPSIDVFYIGFVVAILLPTLPAMVGVYFAWVNPEGLREFLINLARQLYGNSFLASFQIAYLRTSLWLWTMRIAMPILIPLTFFFIIFMAR